MKHLVIWRLELALVSAELARAIARMPDYGAALERQGKVLARYHIVGAHGGAWIYQADSHEELERLLARSPVFNFARYEVLPLADMADAPVGDDLTEAGGGAGPAEWRADGD